MYMYMGVVMIPTGCVTFDHVNNVHMYMYIHTATYRGGQGILVLVLCDIDKLLFNR